MRPDKPLAASSGLLAQFSVEPNRHQARHEITEKSSFGRATFLPSIQAFVPVWPCDSSRLEVASLNFDASFSCRLQPCVHCRGPGGFGKKGQNGGRKSPQTRSEARS